MKAYSLTRLLSALVIGSVDSAQHMQYVCVYVGVSGFSSVHQIVGRHSRHTVYTHIIQTHTHTIPNLCFALLCSLSIHTPNEDRIAIAAMNWNFRLLKNIPSIRYSPSHIRTQFDRCCFFLLPKKFHRCYRFSIRKINFQPSHIILLIEVEIFVPLFPSPLSEILIE